MHLINQVIEHSLFKPIAATIVTLFLLIRGFEYGQSLFVDYREFSEQKRLITPIKINISASGMSFDIDEDQEVEHRIKSGDTMLKIIADIGASEQDVFAILNSMKKVFNPKSITVGDVVTVKYRVKIGYDAGVKVDSGADMERHVIVNSVVVSPSPEEEIIVSRKNNGEYDTREIKLNLLRN